MKIALMATAIASCLASLLLSNTASHTVLAHKGSSNNEVIIHISKDGFEPSKATIVPGAKVIFENIDTEEHWPASDNHPSHTQYDGTSMQEHCTSQSIKAFDSCAPIPAGKTWSFTFGKSGTFNYHDHLWPHLNGTITVESTADEPKGILSQVFNWALNLFTDLTNLFAKSENTHLNSRDTDASFYQGQQKKYVNLVQRQDPRAAIHALSEDSQSNSRVSAICHDLLHEIGKVSYQKYGSFSESIKFQSDFCNSGYIHGIFEAYFQSSSDPMSGIAQQCLEYASAGGRQFDLWQCHHGVGHGFMYLTGGDLDESLLLCEQGLEESGVESCQNGVYMEVFNREVLAKENGYIDSSNPLATCAARDRSKEGCYMYIPTYLSQTKAISFPQIFKECDKAEADYIYSCAYGVGAEAIKRNPDQTDNVFKLCRQAGSLLKQDGCVRGIVAMYMNQKGSYNSGKDLCVAAPLNYRKVCNDVVSSSESFFN